MSMQIKRVFIANRGEIARRIIRTLKAMHIETALAYSEADAGTIPAREADIIIPLSGNTPQETYLDIKKVIHAAKKAKADAIHPGYGFLSENAQFAAECKKAGILFIGPSPKVLDLLGDKIAALKVAEKHKVPTIPGVNKALKDYKEALMHAKTIGYPILLKAAAGGGGRGIRIVRNDTEMTTAFSSASAEAIAAFGDGSMFLEKYLENVKHLEVQVARDSHGNCIAFGERDCSLQRRHQKLLEEAPGPLVTASLRKKLESCACTLFHVVGFVGIGTVEFLFDGKQAYFMEVNPRIQVEHPVTEMVTGMDFVKIQVEIAQGKKLPKPPRLSGHAIEVRLLAENSYEGGIPTTGKITSLTLPSTADVRWESALECGSVISPYYDSMIGKLICYGKDRKAAYALLKNTLKTLHLSGLITNIAYLREMLDTSDVKAGTQNTGFFSSFTPAIPKHKPLAALATLLPVSASRIPPKDSWFEEDHDE